MFYFMRPVLSVRGDRHREHTNLGSPTRHVNYFVTTHQWEAPALPSWGTQISFLPRHFHGLVDVRFPDAGVPGRPAKYLNLYGGRQDRWGKLLACVCASPFLDPLMPTMLIRYRDAVPLCRSLPNYIISLEADLAMPLVQP